MTTTKGNNGENNIIIKYFITEHFTDFLENDINELRWKSKSKISFYRCIELFKAKIKITGMI